MKITKINVYLEKTPEQRPGWRPILCRVFTDEGIYGDGEAAIAYGQGAPASFSMIKDIAPLVIGKNPLDNEVIWNTLYRETCWGQCGGPIVFSAIAAIDMAIWDIKGKALNLPLSQLMGGKFRDKLRGYASQLQFGWGKHLLHEVPTDLAYRMEQYRENAQNAIDEGYTAVKVDLGKVKNGTRGIAPTINSQSLMTEEQLDMYEERCAIVRETIGPKVDLLIECHSQFDAPGAVKLAQRIEKYNIYFMEEPNTPNPVTAKYIHDHVNIPIAQGERIYTRMQYLPYFQDQSLQVIQPDIGTCGGITETKKVCDMAYAYDIGVQIHTCASPLHTAAALGMEAAMPNFCIHEHHVNNLHDYNIMLCDEDIQPVDGYFEVPTRPGIGVEFTDYALTKNVDCMATVDKGR